MAEAERKVCHMFGLTAEEFQKHQSPERVSMNAMSGNAKSKLLSVMKKAADTKDPKAFLTACKSLHLALSDYNGDAAPSPAMGSMTRAEEEVISRFTGVSKTEYMNRKRELGVSLNDAGTAAETPMQMARAAILKAMGSFSDDEIFAGACAELGHQLVNWIWAMDAGRLVSDTQPVEGGPGSSLFVYNESGRSMVEMPIRS